MGAMKRKNKRPRKSLRTLLIMWLIMFSVVPLAFITGYSLVKYEQAIDKELGQRLLANFREIQIILGEFQTELVDRNKKHAGDKTLSYYLSTNQIPKARELATDWMRDNLAHQISIFSQDGRLEIALFRGEDGEVKRFPKLEGGDVYLSDRFLKKTKQKSESALADFSSGTSLDLIAFSSVINSKGDTVGYIEEVVKIDQAFLGGLRNRLGLEVVFFDSKGESIVTSHEDLAHYKKNFFVEQFQKYASSLFELNIRDIPFGFITQPTTWGEDDFYVSLGASKRAAREVLKNVNVAFFSVVGTIIVLLIFLSVVISKIVLRPLNELVESIENMDLESGPVELKSTSESELGLLTESFNEMSQRVHNAQSDLKENIKKLEIVNQENRETQAKLVHAAKMAGLGQLVAGIAHELNNPISFIYSNMTHLKDYSEKLISIIKKADRKTDISKEKEDAEFDYITKDLPKLIQSCEEGARRTRDIVIGLRNFSRLEEALIKEVDIHEGLDATLALLQGEFQSKVEVVKNYGKLPKVLCYPSQLNQVFMNILANAAHAIETQGKITISTAMADSQRVQISIKDTGRGMTPEIAQQIFDPFFTTKGVSEGTGLGLSISYGIIQRHGGDIQVRSKLGEGTEFIISLPVRSQTVQA